MSTKLDTILTEYNLANHQLVEAFAGAGKQISHKSVQKARTGSRAISRKLQFQVTEALNLCVSPEKPWSRVDLFGDERKESLPSDSL